MRKQPVKVAAPIQNNDQGSATDQPFVSDELRADLVAHSQTYPEENLLSNPRTQRIAILVVVVTAIIGSSLFCFLGPGAPALEANLKRLAQQASLPAALTYVPTKTAVGTASLKDTLSPSPTIFLTATRFLTPTMTGTPTATSTATVEPSPTPIPIENTPTPTSEVAGCVPASEITLADVGKVLCVSGRVFRTLDKPASFIIIVVEEPDAFYYVAYDLKYDKLEKKQCIFATGEIRQLGNNPIMVVSYSVPIQYCP